MVKHFLFKLKQKLFLACQVSFFISLKELFSWLGLKNSNGSKIRHQFYLEEFIRMTTYHDLSHAFSIIFKFQSFDHNLNFLSIILLLRLFYGLNLPLRDKNVPFRRTRSFLHTNNSKMFERFLIFWLIQRFSKRRKI